MMPVQTEGVEDHKAKYKTLKRKLKLLIYENECFQEELRKAQRALLRVRRDKSFLLDRLLQYHRGPDSSSDSEQTEDSDAEVEAKSCRKRLSMDGSGGGGTSNSPGPLGKPPPAKKKKSSSSGGSSKSGGSKHTTKQVPVSSVQAAGSSSNSNANSGTATTVTVASGTTVRKLTAAQLASAALIQGQPRRVGHIGAGGVVVAGAGGGVGGGDGQLSREEVERRLAARQPMNDYTTTTVSLTLPKELFSDIMEGDFKEEEIETSPSNIEDDITVDNYD